MDMLINYMVIARYFMLFVITLIAVVDDYRRYKISNKIIIWGLVISGAMSVAQMCIASLKAGAYIGGLYGGCKNTIMVYVSGMVTAFAVSYVVYRLKGIGAGDVKLLLVAGMFIGARDVLYLIGISLMAGVVTRRMAVIKEMFFLFFLFLLFVYSSYTLNTSFIITTEGNI